MPLKRRRKLLTIVLAGQLAFAGSLSNAAAGPDRLSPVHTGLSKGGYPAGDYFVEFRSRRGFLFGHTFIGYGRLNGNGQPRDIRYAGIYPLDGQRGLIAGSFVPVAASVRAVKEDITERPDAIYRLSLTEAQYVRMRTTVSQLRATERQWHLVFGNCNDFAIKVARQLGLRTPPSLLLPRYFVAELRRLNG